MYNFLSRCLKISKIIPRLKYRFRLPKKNHNIVLDLNNSYYFVKLFKEKKTFFLDTRLNDPEFLGTKNFHNELNLIILIYSILKYFSFTNFTLMQQYIINYIKFIDPKNIITFTDNNLFFLSLKKIFNHKKLIVFQYAWNNRQTFDKMYHETAYKKPFKKFDVDHMCVWGKNSKSFYSQFINTKFTITGSIKNNFFNKKNKPKKNSIVFISQFRLGNDFDKSLKIFKKNDFNREGLKNILKYCIENNFRLKILGCAKKNWKLEKKYFDDLIGQKNFYFLRRTHGLSSYKQSFKYKYFVTFSSSLAYELSTLGKRVAFLVWPRRFKIRYKNIEYKESFYSYKKKTGLIWSNTPSKKEVFRLLNYITKTKDKSWKNIRRLLIDPIVFYDKDNIRTKKLFKDLGIN